VLLLADELTNRGKSTCMLSGFQMTSLRHAGVGATLARDVPFSAVYWGMLEPIRQSLLPSDGSMVTPMRTITVNMLAGGLGGAAASAFTQPLVHPPRALLLLGAPLWSSPCCKARKEACLACLLAQ